MVRTIKMGLKAYCQQFGNIDSYLARMLLSYRSIPHGDRNKSPSALMGRQIRSPFTFSFQTGEDVWFRANASVKPEPAKYISQAGNNTAIILKGDRGTLTHSDQINAMKLEEEEADSDNSQNKINENEIKERNIWSDFLLKENNIHPHDFFEEEDILSDHDLDEQENMNLRRSTRSTHGQKPNRFV